MGKITDWFVDLFNNKEFEAEAQRSEKRLASRPAITEEKGPEPTRSAESKRIERELEASRMPIGKTSKLVRGRYR